MNKKNNINLAHDVTSELLRIGKYLNESISITDSTGKVISKTIKPLMVEFYFRDLLQQIVGATLLAIPLAYTEEVWRLGEELAWINIVMIMIVSIIFLSSFTYYNFYNNYFMKHWFSFVKRIISVYIISLLVSFLILTLIDRAPLDLFWDVTIKRMILVSLPAAMSASIADFIK